MTDRLSARDRSRMLLSDKLRDLRFTARRVAELPRQADEHDRGSAIYNMANALANVSNRFLNTAESGLISMLASEPEHHQGLAPAYGFDRYFTWDAADGAWRRPDEESPSAFAREQYFAAKRLLSMTGNTTVLMHEERFLPVRLACEGALGDQSRTAEPGAAGARLAAAFTLATVEAAPVLSPQTFRHAHFGEERVDFNVFVGASLGLVGALAMADGEDAGSDILYTSAIAAVAARYRTILAALRADDPIEALTAFDVRMLRHLP